MGTNFTKFRLLLHKVSCIIKVYLFFYFLFLRETLYVCGVKPYARCRSSRTLFHLFVVLKTASLKCILQGTKIWMSESAESAM